jgi:hypothetical protein
MVKLKGVAWGSSLVNYLGLMATKDSARKFSLRYGYKVVPVQILISESNYKKLCPEKKSKKLQKKK